MNMSRFIRKPTVKEKEAINILRKMSKAFTNFSSLYATVQSGIEKMHIERRLKEIDNTATQATPRWLNKKRRKDNDYTYGELHIDHTSYWQDKKTGERVIITEPYDLNTDNILKLAEQIKKHNLDVTISADSQHFPGYTLRVEYRLNSK